jgi:hypothetical protein
MTLEAALENYIENHQVDGIAYTRHISSGLYWTDDDNALYTGLQLGAMAYRYAAAPSEDKLEAIRLCLRGVSLLTTATSTRGVLVRRAMPESRMLAFGLDYPLPEGNFWRTKVLESRIGYTYQLKTTKDQITGILFGLSACRTLLPGVDAQIDDAVAGVITDLYHAIRNRGWSVRDHLGRSHGTSAAMLDAPLRLNLEALAYSVGLIGEKPHQGWFNHVGALTFHYNTFFQNAYSHGLNAITAHALDLLSDYHADGPGVEEWSRRIDRVTRHEHNPFWELLLANRLTPRGAFRLGNLSLNPYTRFFVWNKYEADITQRADTSGPQIDLMLAGFMRDYYERGDAS